jgi:hypothetical protein
MILKETVFTFGTDISLLPKKTVLLSPAYLFWQTITVIQVTKSV